MNVRVRRRKWREEEEEEEIRVIILDDSIRQTRLDWHLLPLALSLY